MNIQERVSEVLSGTSESFNEVNMIMRTIIFFVVAFVATCREGADICFPTPSSQLTTAVQQRQIKAGEPVVHTSTPLSVRDGQQPEPAPPRPSPPPPPPPFPPPTKKDVQPPAEPKRKLVGLTQADLKRIGRDLPHGAEIYTYPVGDTDLAAAVIIADLDGDGQAEAVVVYYDRPPTSREGSLPLVMSVFKRNGRHLEVRSSVTLVGNVFFTAEVEGLGAPFAERDVTADGTPEIIVVSGMGASVGGALQIFSFQKGSLEELARIGGHFFQVRSAGGGKTTVITARSRYERESRVYSWTGRKFEQIGATGNR